MCVGVGRAASGATFRINGVDIGLAAEQGTLERVLKLGGDMSLLHDLAFSARTLLARRIHCGRSVLCCASCPVVRAG